MFSNGRSIEAGDTVMVWFSRDSVQAIQIEPGKELHGRFGVFRHDDIIGTPYGSKVASRNNKGFIHLLRPTPELWTLALPHRTQILYVADIAFITAWLGIRPGSVVIEAGTGSGSFSHSLARTIGPAGHLHTFEFHESRMLSAKKEFEEHGMSSYITLKHQNVIKDGFDLDSVVDAVFLDLPAPWDAIASAKKAMKKDQISRICCFSPCMEQVLRTVTALNDNGFSGITMYETLLRQQEVWAYPPLKDIEDSSERIKASAVKREERRQRQIADSKLLFEERKQAPKRKRDDEDLNEVEDTQASTSAMEPPSTPPTIPEKKLKITQQDLPSPIPTVAVMTDERPASPLTTPAKPSPSKPPNTSTLQSHQPSPTPAAEKALFSRPSSETRGHTSYLTFAYLVPTIYPGSGQDAPAPAPATSLNPASSSQITQDMDYEDEGAEMDVLFAAASQEELDRIMQPPSPKIS